MVNPYVTEDLSKQLFPRPTPYLGLFLNKKKQQKTVVARDVDEKWVVISLAVKKLVNVSFLLN